MTPHYIFNLDFTFSFIFLLLFNVSCIQHIRIKYGLFSWFYLQCFLLREIRFHLSGGRKGGCKQNMTTKEIKQWKRREIAHRKWWCRNKNRKKAEAKNWYGKYMSGKANRKATEGKRAVARNKEPCERRARWEKWKELEYKHTEMVTGVSIKLQT